MPHVALVPFTGFRIREEAMLELGMSLPGLRARAGAIAQLPALGLLTLAGLTPPNWTCSYHEARCAGEELADEIAATKPTLVALSALTASIDEAYCFSDMLRSRGARVVLGGLHATACPDEAAEHCDIVVVGDGEPVWQQILLDAERGSFRSRYSASSPFDLGGSPVPRWDLLGNASPPRFTLQTQRGCPFACEFCAASRLLGPHRLKPIANIKRELDALPHRGHRMTVELADDNTFAGRGPAGELLDALAATGVRYFTEVDWRVGEDRALLARLAASGCVQVLVGIESLVFRHPGMGSKRAELPRIIDAIEAIQADGVAVNACFIVGCDGETLESIDRLAELVERASFADIQLTIQTPFPGTALRRRLGREGRLLPARGWSSYTLFDVTYQPDEMTVGELEAAFRCLVRRVFSPSQSARRQAIRRRVWQNHPGLKPCGSELSPST